jgi:hypothetical protein
MRARVVLSAALLVAATGMVLAQTTNSITPAQRAAAEAAAKAAGYTPTQVADAQGGAIFLWALKDGRRYYLTVTSDGKVHAGGTALPTATPPDLRELSAQ